MVYHIDLGLSDYRYCWELQKKIHLFKQQNKSPDVIITTEHNHVYTLGKAGTKDHLLINDVQLKNQNIAYYEIDRGGDLTYHGPGQLVCYPIFDLNNFYLDTHKYLRDLEEVIVQTLKAFNIDSRKDEEYTGVWVGEEKICAIGIKVSKWITMHGLAFNINNELNFFDKIIPCGIFHKGVTSLKKLTNLETDMKKVTDIMIMNMKSVFKIETKEINIDRLTEEYSIN
jgi:lipoyl(octanoyl) transferase